MIGFSCVLCSGKKIECFYNKKIKYSLNTNKVLDIEVEVPIDRGGSFLMTGELVCNFCLKCGRDLRIQGN